MKNKGFTLVELLGVIVILAIIALIVFPAVNNVISTSKETVYQTQINKILKAACDFSLQNTNYLPDKGDKAYVTLGELKYEGLIDVDIKNTETKKVFEDNLVVSINNVGANYKYSNINSKLEGDYLYTVEELKNNTVSIESTIQVLSQNSDGNYIIILNSEEEFNLEEDIKVSVDGELLTPHITRYITKNNQMVENVDISKSSVYKVYYSAVSEKDNKVFVNYSTLSIIVSDEQSPTINSLDNVTISKDITSFDLLSGVTCEDNSGYCDITTSGEIDYGVEGKYIIEYTVKDPSGNTRTKERVITIK